MKDGHPFLTQHLDDRRVRQRRWLRGIPSLFLPQNPIAQAATKHDLVEEWLRDRADAEYAGIANATAIMDATIRRDQSIQARDLLQANLSEERRHEAHGDEATPLHGDFAAIMQELVRDSQTREPATAEGLAWVHLATFLVLADAVADDGYKDPRLP
jgi:hypothetical protein